VGKVRAFDTGATRDADDEKFDPEGFIDPRVLFAYSKYMHKNRHQSDGTLRASDNWQKGIPRDQYMKSLLRHVMDLWADHRGCPQSRNEDGQVPPLDETLGGILFNAMGYWHEVLKAPPVIVALPADADTPESIAEYQRLLNASAPQDTDVEYDIDEIEEFVNRAEWTINRARRAILLKSGNPKEWPDCALYLSSWEAC
jgi:hypothetical protein